MPGLDRTGPFGQGPMTGRGLGRCSGAQRVGIGAGRRGYQGGGARRGAGGGWGNRYQLHATGLTGWQRAAVRDQELIPMRSLEEEVTVLREQVALHQAAVRELEQRLDHLAETAANEAPE